MAAVRHRLEVFEADTQKRKGDSVHHIKKPQNLLQAEIIRIQEDVVETVCRLLIFYSDYKLYK